MRKFKFQTGEYYHIYNQGVDQRNIFPSELHFLRFLESAKEFNTIEPIGSLYQLKFEKEEIDRDNDKKLVDFVAYCLNPNHYHLLLRQLKDSGPEKFMHRLGTGYTNYFNRKNKRRGSLFQGRFKAVHVDSNQYLLHLSAYINLNYRVHGLRSSTSKSSWDQYIGKKPNEDNVLTCNKEIILDQFKNFGEYKKFAEEALTVSIQRKDMEHLLLEDLD